MKSLNYFSTWSSVIKIGMYIFVFVFNFLFFNQVHATHNRAGEITFIQTGPLTIEVTITTYTKSSSIDADRDSLKLFWGDGEFMIVGRKNGGGKGVDIGNDVKLNIYIASHSYKARSNYTLAMQDPNRNGGILNVNPPNSESVPFYLETTFSLLNVQFQGYNNSATLLQPPIDVGCVGFPFVHNPNASDIDGDSLAYEMIIPKWDLGNVVPNYINPSQISPGVNNEINLDPISGYLTWISPQVAGEYNIAIRINEFRNGVLINSTTRDMQILILSCNNNPPIIESPSEICIIAGQTLKFDVIGTDNESPPQKIKLSALGGAFDFSSRPATFNAPANFEIAPVKGTFSWTPTCNDISPQFYTVVFKAVDNAFFSFGSSNLSTTRIKVIGPPPLNLVAINQNQNIKLSWDAPYACEITENEYFRGFNVWRKENSSYPGIDTCYPTLTNKGFIKIAFQTKSLVNDHYEYIDQNASPEKTYCYRIEAEFARLTPDGFTYNTVTSIPSNESCQTIDTLSPQMLNVSIEKTNTLNGEIFIKWIKPSLTKLDTTKIKPAYSFQSFFNTGFYPNTLALDQGGTFISLVYKHGLDTLYISVQKNTTQNVHSFQSNFIAGKDFSDIGKTALSSSIYLNTQGSDREVILSWVHEVPWINTSYIIYKSNGLNFDSVTTVYTNKYTDKGLVNGISYCYKIKSKGNLFFSNLKLETDNFSQESCATAIDTIPPCTLILDIKNNCGSTSQNSTYSNILSWKLSNKKCDLNDVKQINIYYAASIDTTFELIASIEDNQMNTFSYVSPENGLAGCFYVTTEDELGNESQPSPIICKTNCPDYDLPNSFSPNNDGKNDIFKPFPYQFVAKIEMEIVNRWGNVVFRTQDPNILWDGTDLKGKELSSSTYFYNCNVYQNDGNSISIYKKLTGFIELLK